MNVFWPLRGRRRKEARESTPCKTHPWSPFHHLIRQVSPGVMKVTGFDVDIGEEGVLVEENRASSVMGHVEPTSEDVMVDILR